MENILKAIIVGIVEGLTEFLPVSSTGHLLIAESILNYHQSDAFNVLIQVGPIVAVTVVFWKYLLELALGLKDPLKRDEAIKLTSCFVLTGIGGLIATKCGLALPDNVLPIAIATLIGAGVIYVIEKHAHKHTLSETITWPIVVAVAVGQLIAAIFPGSSRSGSAIMAALLLGLSRPAAVRFVFLVGIPTMFAAGALKVKDLVDAGQAATLYTVETLIAFAVATVTAWLSVVWLLKFVQTRDFIPFVWYRLILGVVMLALLGMNIL
ncbi:MAG: undecaprenyl-diphosphate phosphatase [Fibrobacter sp.]|nr:undecaprenyl-diphosphate phosphatase [Fibrobacter sp.]